MCAAVSAVVQKYAHAVIVHSLQEAAECGAMVIEDPDTATRLLLGALTRGAMLIANADDPVKTRHAVAKSMRALLNSFIPWVMRGCWLT